MKSHKHKKRIAIIGAGPAGITAAYELTKRGLTVTVYEASNHVGGLATTIDLWGQRVDIGPHRFFSSDSRVNKLWLEVIGRDYKMVDRLTRIYYNNRFFTYPIKAQDALAKLGLLESFSCILSYLRERLRPKKEIDTFEDWVVSRFGRRLYEIFFKTYSEKLWGISCQELDADFAAQRIKKFSLSEAIKTAVFGDIRKKHQTLVDRFAYPTNGTGEIYQRMAAFVTKNGGQVNLKSPVHRLLVKDSQATGIELESGSKHSFDHVISTMPLSLLVTRIPGVPEDIRDRASSLSFRNTILVYLKIDKSDLFPDQWLYVHVPALGMGRITNFRNWVPDINKRKPETILCCEFWCYDHDPIWLEKDQVIINQAIKEISLTLLLGSGRVLDGKVMRLHRCYPVYASGYKGQLKPVEKYLSTIKNLSVIGRYGAFKYNNQDHSILMGLLAASNIASNEKHDLWSINTDYEDYQESSIITETGLADQSATEKEPDQTTVSALLSRVKLVNDLPCQLCGSAKSTLVFSDPPFKIVRCISCGLVYTKPRVADKDLQKIYQQEYWQSDQPKDYGYQDYLSQAKNYRRTFEKRARLLRRYQPYRGNVLDVGAGSGYFLQVMRDYGWQTTGIEPSPTVAEYARTNLKLDIKTGTAESVKLPKEKFDLITMWDVIEHLADPQATLRALHQLAKPGATLVLETQNIESAFARLLGRRWHHFKHLEHLYHFSPRTIKQILAQSGWRVEAVTAVAAGKYIDLNFIQERAGRLHPIISFLLKPLRWFGNASFYVNPSDEMIVIAKKET